MGRGLLKSALLLFSKTALQIILMGLGFYYIDASLKNNKLMAIVSSTVSFIQIIWEI